MSSFLEGFLFGLIVDIVISYYKTRKIYKQEKWKKIIDSVVDEIIKEKSK